MSPTDVINVTLFDLLRKVKKLFNSGDDNNFSLRMHEIDVSLTEFIQNFFIGFFRNGYGLNVDGITDYDLKLVKKHFRLKRSKPRDMIVLFEEAIKAIARISSSTYSSPPKEEPLLDVYEKYIPNLLRSAIKAFAELNCHKLSRKTREILDELFKHEDV